MAQQMCRTEEIMRRYYGFADLLSTRAKEDPDAPALLYEDHGSICRISCSLLLEQVSVLSRQIRVSGKKCIGILCDGSPQCVITVFASVLAGAQTVLLDESASEELLAQQICASDVDVLWGDEDLAQDLKVACLNSLIPDLEMDSPNILIPYPEVRDGQEPVNDDPEAALKAGCSVSGDILFFTSGTTSRSKAVVLTDRSLTASAFNGSSILPLSSKDRLLCILPLNHVFGFVCGLLWGLACGAPVALGRGPRHYSDDAKFFSPTVLSAVPSLLLFLLQHGCLNPELRTVLVGAGSCPPSILELAGRSGLHVCFGYGMTETSSGIALSISGDPYALQICPLNEVRIAPDGEILVRAGDCMMKGYYKQPEMTQTVLENGTLHTGDLGQIDADGRLHITGRKKEMLVLPDGTKLFLPEYEAAIAAVIGDKDFAVIERDLSPVMVIHDDPSNRAFLSAQLKSLMQQYPRGQQLRDMIFLSKPLPRTATGKVRRWELSQIL